MSVALDGGGAAIPPIGVVGLVARSEDVDQVAGGPVYRGSDLDGEGVLEAASSLAQGLGLSDLVAHPFDLRRQPVGACCPAARAVEPCLRDRQVPSCRR